MNFIAKNFEDFLNNYNPTKLGFIVSQSNVENYLRTEFAWYLAKKYSESDDYKIFIELQRVDLQVISTPQKIKYLVEFGHMVNLHKIVVDECFNGKYKSDENKFTEKNKGKYSNAENQGIENQFVHINMLTEFNTIDTQYCEIEENAATFVKYGKTQKADFDVRKYPDWKIFPFSWKKSKGNLIIDIRSKIL